MQVTIDDARTNLCYLIEAAPSGEKLGIPSDQLKSPGPAFLHIHGRGKSVEVGRRAVKPVLSAGRDGWSASCP